MLRVNAVEWIYFGISFVYLFIYRENGTVTERKLSSRVVFRMNATNGTERNFQEQEKTDSKTNRIIFCNFKSRKTKIVFSAKKYNKKEYTTYFASQHILPLYRRVPKLDLLLWKQGFRSAKIEFFDMVFDLLKLHKICKL